MSFYLPPDSITDSEALFRVLKIAAETARTIVVAFDPASGRFDRAQGRIAYRVCAVTSGSDRFGHEGGLCPSGAAPPEFGSAISQLLSMGVADSATGRTASINELDSALSDTGLNPALRVIALRARAEAHSGAAMILAHDQPAADAHLLAALRDVTSWTKLLPDDRNAWLQSAALLTSLGAYGDAIRGYRAIAVRWTNEEYQSAVRISAIFRIQGRYPEALAELNRLVEVGGPQGGMKFHYHRGWTLTLLGRFDEAIRELSEGLEQQPDYAWARLRRACAYAAVGMISRAAADQRQAADELAVLLSLDTQPTAASRADVAHASALADQLEALRIQGSTASVTAACNGYTDPERKRTTSALLTTTEVAAALLPQTR
jgi:tetratricopeptide (TPR) repeat protein